jgi:hypothetical protein
MKYLHLKMFELIFYTIIFFFFYRLSGAHQKPTSDKAYDPTIEHQNNFWYRTVRAYEEQRRRALPAIKEPLQKLTVPILKDPNSIHFNYLSDGKTRPVVIEGLVNGSAATKKWSPSHFQKQYGETTLLTLVSDEKQKNAYTSFTQKANCQRIPLKESIQNMHDRKRKYYVNNVTEIFMKHPQLISDLELNRLRKIDESINENSWLKVNLFLGGPDTASSLHCAVGGNFFLNLVGKKKWTLIDPKYSKYFKMTPSENFGFAISGYDLDDPEQCYEINRKIPMYEVVLDPGDCLYVPPWWLHHVSNETDFSIGVAVRDHTVYTQCWKNNPMFMLLSPYWYKLHPLVLSGLTKIFGREYLLRNSMQSDEAIMRHLSGKLQENT